jgi:hypothetical protein
MRLLFDKSVVRKLLRGMIKLNREEKLDDPERSSLEMFELILSVEEATASISRETENILKRLGDFPEVSFLLESVEVLYVTRYYKRWKRRLRKLGFTNEDAKILSYAFFGVDNDGRQIGAEIVITWDRHLWMKYTIDGNVIADRLNAMVQRLHPPFINVMMPLVKIPTELLP